MLRIKDVGWLLYYNLEKKGDTFMIEILEKKRKKNIIEHVLFSKKKFLELRN